MTGAIVCSVKCYFCELLHTDITQIKSKCLLAQIITFSGQNVLLSSSSLTKSRLMTLFSVYFGCASLCSVRECLDSVSILSHSSYKQQYFKMLLSSSFLILTDTWILSEYCSSQGHTKTTSTWPVNQIVNHRSSSSTSSVALVGEARKQ